MGDWSGEVYVYEGNGRLFHGTTKVRFDGVQEPMGGKRRIIRRASTELDTGSTWWHNLRRQTSAADETTKEKDSAKGPAKLFEVGATTLWGFNL